MFARVQWYDAKGNVRNDKIDKPHHVGAVLELIERQGGRISKYNRVLTVG